MALIDISPPLRVGIGVFPGDALFRAQPTFTIGPGCPVNVAEIAMSTHCGAHADAPLHYDPDGASIDALDLADFIGPARVIDARGSGALCQFDEIASAFDGAPPRVLLRLMDRIDPMVWPTGFRALAPEAVEHLAARGVRLIGVDVPSVDPETSKDLPSHMVCRAHDLRIIENLVLSDVTPGDYELIALPLKLAGLDAAPLRAVLRR
ncbi:arylformamidase [Bradyrhizobium canariense]|uniref:Kynurenine formamidase n=1 Tax=Bradyrhizobium canariense TaxID=255045 RepID=A0A1H2BM90_9BRAD|nr:arylformamidase [Bradyrhizobium canariense]SDT59009.1 Kynurenine formamidase [Bradyrhizobium canariense]